MIPVFVIILTCLPCIMVQYIIYGSDIICLSCSVRTFGRYVGKTAQVQAIIKISEQVPVSYGNQRGSLSVQCHICSAKITDSRNAAFSSYTCPAAYLAGEPDGRLVKDRMPVGSYQL